MGGRFLAVAGQPVGRSAENQIIHIFMGGCSLGRFLIVLPLHADPSFIGDVHPSIFQMLGECAGVLSEKNLKIRLDNYKCL